MRYHVYQFSDETDNFDYLGPNLPKNELWDQNFKNLSLDSESASLRYCLYQFSDKSGNFDPKSGFGISILEIPCVPIFRWNGQLWLFGPKFALKWTLASKFRKSKSRFKINTSIIPCVRIFSQNGQLLIFRPKFGEIV